MNLNDVNINTKDTAAVNYVRARHAIEAEMPNRKMKRDAKMAVIEFLKGELAHSGRHIITFPDNTKAKF